MEGTPTSNDSRNSVSNKRADKIEVLSPADGTTPSIARQNAPSFGSVNRTGDSVLTPSNTRVPSTPSSKRGKRPSDGSTDKKISPKPKSKRARSDVHETAAGLPKTTIQNPAQPPNAEEGASNKENEDPAVEEDSANLLVNREDSVSSNDPPSEVATQTPQTARAKRAPSFRIPDVRRMPISDFNMLLPKKTFSGVYIDKEVEERKDETTDQLFEQVMHEVAVANGDGEWKYDYVVSTMRAEKKIEDTKATKEEEKRKRTKNKIVIKGKGYPIPNIMRLQWNFVPTKEQEPYWSYWQREKDMDRMEKFMIKEFGGDRKEFLAKYPHRYSPDEEGVTESEFITNQISVIKGVLRSIEWRITLECDLIHLPPILFVDWTGTTDRDSLPHFKFTNEYVPSKKVQKAMNTSNEYAAIRCNKTCDDHPCDSALLNPILRERLTCKCQIKKTIKGRQSCVDNSPVECIDACSCDATVCGNRVIQRGRQHRMQVWKDWRKGWTLRTLSAIKKGEYVGEYIGEVITYYESQQRNNSVYFMDMPNQREIEDPDEKNGKTMHFSLVIDALEYGNETRFISHSCDPNLNLVASYIERNGGWYSRMAFIAKRDIAFGEELTFDYFPKYKVQEGDKKYNDLPIFESCFCETEKCKFKFLLDLDQDLAKKRRKEQEDERKKASAMAEDSWDEDTDTEEEKAERLKKQRASRKDRNEKRNNLKAKTEEEEAIAMAIEAIREETEKNDSSKMEEGAEEAKRDDDYEKEEQDENEKPLVIDETMEDEEIH